MSSIKGKNTKPELILRNFLWNNVLKGYRIHSKEIAGRPDIAYTKYKIAIFVNGCFWHRCPKCKPPFPNTHKEFWEKKFNCNVMRDRKIIDHLQKNGWITLVFWECEINQDVNEIGKKISSLIFKNTSKSKINSI